MFIICKICLGHPPPPLTHSLNTLMWCDLGPEADTSNNSGLIAPSFCFVFMRFHSYTGSMETQPKRHTAPSQDASDPINMFVKLQAVILAILFIYLLFIATPS